MYSALAKALPLLLLAAAGAQQDEAAAPSGNSAAGLRHRGSEDTSAEPLTFEFADPEPVDRERLLLATAEEKPEEDVEDPEELTFDDEGADQDAPAASEPAGPLDFETDGDLTDEEKAMLLGMEDFYATDGAASEDEGDVDVYAASYDLGLQDMDFFDQAEEALEEEWSEGEGEALDMVGPANEVEEGEGFEDVDEPAEAEGPITRRLRRRFDQVAEAKVEDAEVKEVEAYPDGMDEERYLAEKAELRAEYESVELFEPTEGEDVEFFDLTPYLEPEFQAEAEPVVDRHGRLLQGCRQNQKRVMVEVKTDNSGHENSWTIRKGNGALVMRGPPAGRRYGDNRRYVGAACLNPGTYIYTMIDKFRDGMCGNRSGRGYYRVYVGGNKKHTSPSNCNVNWGKRQYRFQIRQTVQNRPPASRPNPSRPNQSRPQQAAISGRGGCTNVKVQFKVDKYGKETSMTLSGNGRTVMSSRNEVGAYGTKTISKCLPPGTYTLRMQDRDGICCNNGKGWYKMTANGKPAISGAHFIGSKSHTIKIGYNWASQMSNRDREWLNAHNARRRKYNGGQGYVPLKYSSVLKRDAQSYANRLAGNCGGALRHASGISDGENLARNQGSGSWGQQKSSEQIMRRWVENELSWKWPKNAHYTQVVWRATQYVGCGDGTKRLNGNSVCRTQVCRYARAGNCNVRNGNWRSEAWKDSTKCGRECPGMCYV
ncbi:hypothetical protein ACHAXT_002502 [Thalassiosira profunda]